MHPYGRLLVYLFDDGARMRPSNRLDEDAPEWSPRRAAAWRTWAQHGNRPAEDSDPIFVVGPERVRLPRRS
jgi:hypothetical protein